MVATDQRPSEERSHALGREWADILDSVPLFAGLPKRHRRRIAKIAQRHTFAQRTTIVGPGRRSDCFYVILDGDASVTTVTGDRITLGPGRFFGEMALLDDGPPTATVVAETDMTVMRVSRTGFRKLVESEPRVALVIMKELAARLRRIEAEVHR